ncbi:MAG TPA: hypothetical protein VNQ79_12360 [Blastocatellia bacterium]|nr:hypothetical protein [Blastocatellia bacterium]
MKSATIIGGAFAIVLGLAITGYLVLRQNVAPATPASTATRGSTAAAEAHPGFLYGRITLEGGTTCEGRLRWGRDQEAFWGDYFNGFKQQNPWAAHVPPELLKKPRPIRIFGIEIARREGQIDLTRPFMARFGDITRIELLGRNVRVTLKSGTVFDADWYSSNDLDDGVRVWDGRRGILDFGPRQIRAIDFLPAPQIGAVPRRLHGTVRTRQGDFTGFIQWNRNKGVGTDELSGRTADGNLNLRFENLRSIARHSSDSSLVTLPDGREIVLSGAHEIGDGNRPGIYVDDQRYGRVLVSWDAFERLDFSPGGSGPAYGDFPPGQPLTGSVTTRDGRRLVGRLVYDLDESETTETLDAPSKGVTYTIPFGLIASILLPRREERGTERARVTLHNGEELQLECSGDLGEGNGGMLIFADGSQRPEYVLWTDVEQVAFDRPPSMYPPPGGHQIAGAQVLEVDGKPFKAKGTRPIAGSRSHLR